MFCSISARSGLRPDDHNPRHILDLFAEQVAAQRALSVPMPTNPRSRAVAMECLRRIGEPGGTHNVDVAAEIHRAFRDETGMTLGRWRYAARMRIARDLLAGAPPSAVARRTGYAHLPTSAPPSPASTASPPAPTNNASPTEPPNPAAVPQGNPADTAHPLATPRDASRAPNAQSARTTRSRIYRRCT